MTLWTTVMQAPPLFKQFQLVLWIVSSLLTIMKAKEGSLKVAVYLLGGLFIPFHNYYLVAR